MNVVVKEIDRYNSTRFKGNTVSRYLIYLMVGNVTIKCEEATGDLEKNDAVQTLILRDIMKYNPTSFLGLENYSETLLDHHEYNTQLELVKYITLEEVKKQPY